MKNNKRFEHQYVLVTGGARGIGFEICRQFALEGANLFVLDRHKENLMQATEKLKSMGTQVLAFEVDVSDYHQVGKIIDQCEAIAPIEILINNAGIASETGFLHISPEEWKKTIEVNLNGMFYVSQYVCRKMAARQKGVVVNMSSKNGMDGEAGYAHYNASKGGVNMLTKTMALELAHLNVRVNAVCPGYIQTPMSIEIDSPEFVKDFSDRYIPLDRPGRVEEAASLFLFLASEESSFITGQLFFADGGQLAGQKPGKDLLKRLFNQG
jgi:3-oxoacyl-[acyl-carrier protein] reductase